MKPVVIGPAVRLSPSLQLRLPKAIADKLGVTPGTFFLVEEHNGRVTFTPHDLVAKDVSEAMAHPSKRHRDTAA